MVRSLASHLYDQGSIPVVGMWVGCLLAPRVFLQVLPFSSIRRKLYTSKFQFDLDVKCLHKSTSLGRLGVYSLHYHVKFDLLFLFLLKTAYDKKKPIVRKVVSLASNFLVLVNFGVESLEATLQS